MSINTDPFQLPDEKALEKLANEFFAALPGSLNPVSLTQPVGLPLDQHALNQPVNMPVSQTPNVPQGYTFPGAVPSGLGVSPFSMDRDFPTTNFQSGVPESYLTYQHGLPKSISGVGASPGILDPEKILNFADLHQVMPNPEYAGIGKIPASVSGFGKSPDAHMHPQSFKASKPQTNLPDSHFASQGNVPKSVAGSGVSPSVVDHQGKEFDVSDPQTSLPDPHFAGQGVVPNSEAGSGISQPLYDKEKIEKGANGIPTFSNAKSPATVPSELNQSEVSPFSFQNNSPFGKLTTYLPPGVEQPFGSELQQLLGTINTSAPTSQRPFLDQAIENPLFYFLSGKNSAPFDSNPTAVANYISIKDKVRSQSNLPFDANIIKRDFPILQERVNGKQIVWLDNAATTQKPKQVIDRISYFYEHENSNIHRAAHELAARATDAYEGARKKVQHFLNAASINEIIFVRGATEAINLIAKSWGEQYLGEGDEIIVSHLEHHANIVPWQQLAAKKGVKIRVIPVDEDGQILLDEYSKLLGPKTKLVSFTQVSNALGTVTPAKRMVEMAHQAGAKVLVDGAQSVSHMRVDVQSLNCDWFVFSGHKVFGPTGIGVVYGKESLLNETQPWQGGGNMIVDVTFEHTKFHSAPGRFEAGTGNIADAVGLGAAIDYVSGIGMEVIHQYEHYLLMYATSLMKNIPGLRMIGTAAEKASVLSFVFEGFRTDEVGVALNIEGIAVRAGHHCAQPILRRFGLETTIRPSLAFYNTCSDIDRLVSTLLKLRNTRPLRK